eukprot:TRINITY_DN1034_c0_g1_i66.p1 TRINITY_DN1034_c0_g1~~TRINITY_DN1034_c0_g1_i66.p1  ORF type:complete len:198 (+),score=32.29 TRINITY_DN1034_c0_g1_i66:394-987(+)
MAGLLINSLSVLALPSVVGHIIDIISQPEGLGQLDFYCTSLLAIFGIGTVGAFVRVLTLTIASEGIVQKLRNDLFSAILNQEISFFDSRSTGELVSRLSTDTFSIGSTILREFSHGIRRFSEGIIGLAMLLYLSPYLTAIILLLVPPVTLGGVFYGRAIRRFSTKTTDKIAATTAMAEERINAIRIVKSYVQEQREA